jgi:hypothetical protein
MCAGCEQLDASTRESSTSSSINDRKVHVEHVRAAVNGEQLGQRQKRSYSTFQLQVKDKVKVCG